MFIFFLGFVSAIYLAGWIAEKSGIADDSSYVERACDKSWEINR